jgi:PAS domain S-box-containing protein
MAPAPRPSIASRITLRGVLIALGALLVGVNIGSAIWDARTERSRTELSAKRNISNVTSLLAEQTASALDAVDIVLRDAAHESSVDKVAALLPQLKDETAQVPQVAAFLALDAAGMVVGRTHQPPMPRAYLDDRAYFTAHRDGPVAGVYISAPFTGGPDRARWRFVMSRRIDASDGTFGGVVAAIIEIAFFDRLYHTIDLGDDAFITLRAHDGIVITRVPDPRGARGRLFSNPEINAAINRSGRYTGWSTSPIVNERVLLSASTVRGFPLDVLSGATERTVFSPWRGEAWRIAVRTLLTSAAMLLLIALAAWGLTRREHALQRSERRFRAMIERSSDVELLHDADAGKVIYASPSVERVLGYSPAEIMGLPAFSTVYPDDLDRARKLFADLLREQGKVVTTELKVLHKDGSVRWVETTLSNMVNEPGVQAVVVNLRDITERKLAQAEQARLEQRLGQAEKLEAVGRLAGGIAHDFNNILGGILGYGEMLFEEIVEGSPLKRYARNVLAAANRARALVDQILAYSRSQHGRRAPVDIGRAVGETLELVRGSLPEWIRLEATLPAASLSVVGDPTQLHQVLMNLCANAIQAMNKEGILRVTLEPADVHQDHVLAHGRLQPGPYVRLVVQDTGSGMDEDTLSRIFEPFFTTKEVGKGTGLGLSLVYGIVTDCGGAIDVASRAGEGSTFTIYLPRFDTAATPADEDESPVPRGNGERVLLVDDEEPLVAMMSEVLRRLGYEPVGFPDGRTALAEFESAPERFHAVVTDEVMPQLTGTELAILLRRRRGDLPIVLISGYIGPMMIERARAAGVSEILKKPVHSREIAEALAHLLRRAA